jgi:hypothetical protein
MKPAQPTEASLYLRKLAARLVQPYIAIPELRALILTGSAAEGVSDTYSDLDVILYYEQLPSAEAFAQADVQNQVQNHRVLAERTESQYVEDFFVVGVECQFAHTTITEWEADIARVLEEHDVQSPLQKALGGMEDAIILYGEPLVQAWQKRLAAYPQSLAVAMVQHYLSFPAAWGLQDRLATRDGTLWYTEMLVSNVQNLLGTLAGLNHLYFTTFQFKRMQHFIARITIAPPRFGERLEAVFHTFPAAAALELEALARETIALVEQHMPEIDTSRAKRVIGWRPQPWSLPVE